MPGLRFPVKKRITRPKINGQGTQGDDRAHGGGRYMFRQADAVVVKQYDGDGNSCGKSLIFGQRGNKSADGNQSGAHDKNASREP